ncbi:MAG: hypothetical protein Q8868_15530 [Bacteroidota bacterium]|nr:hypothetical protein [Bacteroidota bacterium]
MKRIRSTLILVTVFSIAMGFMESAIVIYLREILYPEGFAFPLKAMPADLSLTECLREVATIVMLLAIGFMAGKSFSQRFAWFIYAFAIWDIFFYVFLKILINWPVSVMTWDLLFLIPVIWTGPIITPVIVSVTMILLSMVILYFSGKEVFSRILIYEWILIISGALGIFISFIWDFSKYISRYYSIRELFMKLQDQSVMQTIMSYSPAKFNWGFFTAGELILLIAIFLYYLRLRKKSG